MSLLGFCCGLTGLPQIWRADNRAGTALTSFLAITPLASWLAAIAAAIVGFFLGWFIFSVITGNTVRRARRDAAQVIQTAKAEGEASRQRIELEAEKRARARRDAIDREAAEATADLKKAQARLVNREDALDK